MAALALLAHANGLDGAFQFDDLHVIQDNPAIRDPSRIPSYFVSPADFSTFEGTQHVYRPALLTTFALDRKLGGGDSGTFKTGNAALHAGVSGLVFLLALRLRLGAGAALAGAALFAVHPVLGESVNYISSRSDVLATGLLLGALLLWWKSFEAPSLPLPLPLPPPSPLLLPAAALLLALSLLSKELAVTAPVLGLLIHVYAVRCGSTPRRAGRHHAVLWGVTLAWFALRAFILRGGTLGEDPPRSVIENLLTQARVLAGHYPVWLLAPLGLSPEHDIAASRSMDLGALAGGLAIIVGAALAAWALFERRNGPAARSAGFAGLWYLLTLAPTSSLIPLKVIAAEHRLYLPCAVLLPVLAALAAAGLDRLAERARWARYASPVLALALVAACLPLAWARNRVWRTPESLWRDVLAKYPDNDRAHVYLGKTLAESGRIEEAEALYRRLVELQPLSFLGPSNLGAILMTRARREQEQGRAEEARVLKDEAGVMLERAAERGHRYADPLYNCAVYLEEEKGELPRAGELYLKALERNPRMAGARASLRRVVRLLGEQRRELDTARRLADGLVALQGQAADYMVRGTTLAIAGRREEARRDFLEVLARDPASANAMLNLAHTWKQDGNRKEAASWYRRVLDLDPDNEQAKAGLVGLGER